MTQIDDPPEFFPQMTSDPIRDSGSAPVITRVRPLPSDPNVRSIFVDGRVVARLRASDIEALGIHVGQTWTADLTTAVDHALELEKARRVALRILGQRDRSSTQLRQRLMQRNIRDEVARAVIDELISDGWLDDLRFAQQLARELASKSGAALALIRQKLTQAGIDETLVHQVTAEVCEDIDPTESAVQAAEAQLRRRGSRRDAKAARQIAAALARRGHGEDAIHAALQQLNLDPAPSSDDWPIDSP